MHGWSSIVESDGMITIIITLMDHATVIEPGERMCHLFVRLVRRLFASSQTLRMCQVRLVAVRTDSLHMRRENTERTRRRSDTEDSRDVAT